MRASSSSSLLLLAAAWAPAALGVDPNGKNPFLGKPLFVNPFFVTELDGTIATATGATEAVLKSIRGQASAHWLDSKSKVKSADPTDLKTLEGILTKAATMHPPPVTTFIVYDLPNRDCHAHASNGEVCCTYNPDGSCDYSAPGDCAEGIHEYQTEYIDPITEVLARFHDKVPIALIIEPDSLPNLATNLGEPRCGNSGTQAAYKAGVKYAVAQIAAKAPKATMYVDAAHGGWLGWTHSLSDYLDVIESLDVVDKVRGFALNTANYQPLGKMCPQYDWCLGGAHANDTCCEDPCKLAQQYNAGNNELNYALALHNFTTVKWPGFEPRFIIDTGRNGVTDMRKSCSNWCNIRGAGVGHVPTTATPSPMIDAFLWLKTPGESDGCTQELPDGTQCKRFDWMCSSEDSLGSRPGEPFAPEAGLWFDYQIKQLASLADLQLTAAAITTTTTTTKQAPPKQHLRHHHQQ